MTKYAIKCKDNDIVDMSVNFVDLTLKYSVNNKDYGVAYQMDETQYKCAVWTYYKNSSIKLTKYEQM